MFSVGKNTHRGLQEMKFNIESCERMVNQVCILHRAKGWYVTVTCMECG